MTVEWKWYRGFLSIAPHPVEYAKLAATACEIGRNRIIPPWQTAKERDRQQAEDVRECARLHRSLLEEGR